jgi:putative ABC transport system permease protein
LSEANLAQLLRECRKLAAGDDDNFNVLDTQWLTETLSGTTQVMTTLLGAVAAVTRPTPSLHGKIATRV